MVWRIVSSLLSPLGIYSSVRNVPESHNHPSLSKSPMHNKTPRDYNTATLQSEDYASNRLRERGQDIERLARENQELWNENQELRDETQVLRDEIQKLGDENRKLRNANEKFESLVEEYRVKSKREQNRYGELTSVKLSDENSSNEGNVVAKIDALKLSLRQFALSKGRSIRVKREKADELLARYVKNAAVSADDKNLLTAAVQRKTIEIIEDKVRRISKEFQETILEESIYYHTTSLKENLGKAVEQWSPEDEVHKVLPTKIRQQIFSYVGDYVYTGKNHNVIAKVAKDVFNEISKYRDILDKAREEKMRDAAREIVKSYLILFRFKLNAQSENINVEWIKAGVPYDSARMEPDEVDDNWDTVNMNMVVVLCMFPLIEAANHEVIYTKAQVIISKAPLDFGPCSGLM